MLLLGIVDATETCSILSGYKWKKINGNWLFDSTTDELKDELYYYSSCNYNKNQYYIWIFSCFLFLSFHRNLLLCPAWSCHFVILELKKKTQWAFNKLLRWKSQILGSLGLLESMMLRMFWRDSQKVFFFKKIILLICPITIWFHGQCAGILQLSFWLDSDVLLKPWDTPANPK